MNLNQSRCIVDGCDYNAHYDKIRPWMKIVYESNQSTWIKLINYFIKSLKVSYIYICCHKQIVWWLIDKVSCCVCCWCTFYLNSCAMWRESVLVWGWELTMPKGRAGKNSFSSSTMQLPSSHDQTEIIIILIAFSQELIKCLYISYSQEMNELCMTPASPNIYDTHPN